MNKIKKVLATAMVGTLAFSAVGCKMIQKTPEAIQKTVIAKIGNKKITKGDLEKLIPSEEQLAQQYGEDYKTNEQFKTALKSLISQLVDEEILVQKAKELNLIPEQSELDTKVTEAIAPQIEQIGGDEAYKKALENMGLTEEEYKKDMERMILAQIVVEDITKDIEVAEEEIKKYYDENNTEFTEADISHILVEDEAKAKEIKEKLDNGGDFEALAKEFSIDGGSKGKGGALGVTKYNTLVPEFVVGLNSIKEGEISAPVKSQFGYHIIKYKDAKVTSFEDAKDSIKTKLEGEQKSKIYDEKLEEWNKELKVKIYEDRL